MDYFTPMCMLLIKASNKQFAVTRTGAQARIALLAKLWVDCGLECDEKKTLETVCKTLNISYSN